METQKIVFIDKETENETYKKLFVTDCEIIDISKLKSEEISAIVFDRLKGTEMIPILQEIAKIEKLIKQIEKELDRAKKNVNDAINRIDVHDCEKWIDIRKGIEQRIERLEEIKQELQKKLPNISKETKIEFEVIGDETILPNEIETIVKKIEDVDKYIAKNTNSENLESLINTYKSMEIPDTNKNNTSKSQAR